MRCCRNILEIKPFKHYSWYIKYTDRFIKFTKPRRWKDDLKSKYCDLKSKRTHNRGVIFPSNLISNHYQVTTFGKCPSFFIKMAPQKKQRATNTKGKKLKVFKVRPTYNELQIMTTMYLKPSKMSQVRVCSWMYVCFKKGPWSVQESVKSQRGPSCGSLGGSRRVFNTAPVHLHSTLPGIWDQTERSQILKINQNN